MNAAIEAGGFCKTTPEIIRLARPARMHSRLRLDHFGNLKGNDMCPNMTQPEEIELALKEIEQGDRSVNAKEKTATLSEKLFQRGWADGYLSPYRAAYMKSHNIVNL